MNQTTDTITEGPTDPAPHLAAEGANSRNENYRRVVSGHSHQRSAVYARVLRAGANGVTIDEVARDLDRPPNAISGRFTELTRAGLGHYSRDVRRPTSSGCTARVFFATEHLPEPDRQRIATTQPIRTAAAGPAPPLPDNQEPQTQNNQRRTMNDQPPTTTQPRLDHHGRPLIVGRRYIVTRPGETGAFSVLLEDDADGTRYVTGHNLNKPLDDLPADCQFAPFAHH